jgi:hypothetical protein
MAIACIWPKQQSANERCSGPGLEDRPTEVTALPRRRAASVTVTLLDRNPRVLVRVNTSPTSATSVIFGCEDDY